MRRKKLTTNVRQPTKPPKSWDILFHSPLSTQMQQKASTTTAKGIHNYLLSREAASKRTKEGLKFLQSAKTIYITQAVVNSTIWPCLARIKGDLTTQMELQYPRCQWKTMRRVIPSNQSTSPSVIFLITVLESSALIQCLKTKNKTQLRIEVT